MEGVIVCNAVKVESSVVLVEARPRYVFPLESLFLFKLSL